MIKENLKEEAGGILNITLLFVNPFYAVQLHIKSNVTALMLNKML